MMPNNHLVTGCDIVQISKFSKALREHSLIMDKIFTPPEKEHKNIASLAGIFAAKEAALKALDLKPGAWLKFTISRETNKKPRLLLDDPALQQKISSIDLSISHDGDYALAAVVAMLK